jgi:hypothetical protein
MSNSLRHPTTWIMVLVALVFLWIAGAWIASIVHPQWSRPNGAPPMPTTDLATPQPGTAPQPVSNLVGQGSPTGTQGAQPSDPDTIAPGQTRAAATPDG